MDAKHQSFYIEASGSIHAMVNLLFMNLGYVKALFFPKKRKIAHAINLVGLRNFGCRLCYTPMPTYFPSQRSHSTFALLEDFVCSRLNGTLSSSMKIPSVSPPLIPIFRLFFYEFRCPIFQDIRNTYLMAIHTHLISV